MTSKTLKSAICLAMLGSAMAIAAGGVAYAKGKPTTEATNNLSVPTIMVGGAAGNLTNCGASDWSELLPPPATAVPLSGYTIDMSAYYFVQKVHHWQAQCRSPGEGELITVYGEWGDNLGGDAKLKAGSPIRLELVLRENSGGGEMAQGYTVVKLEPEKLDRLSAYGTLATEDGAGAYAAASDDMTPLVHDSGAHLLVTPAPDPDNAVVDIYPLAPEINATGKVVYGYNLRVPAAGQYVITFEMPHVTFDGCDLPATCGGSITTMTIDVVGGGGSGGGKKPPRE